MNVNPTISKIVQLINTDNFYKAELALRKIYNNNPQSFDLNKLLGLALLAQRKYNSALKCFERCYEKKKDDYDVVLNLSFIFCKIQFFEQSIEFSNKAIDLRNDRPQAYQNLAMSLFMLGDYEKAKEVCYKAITIRGGFESQNFLDTEDLVVLYGDILIASDQFEEFYSFSSKVLETKYIQKLLIRLLREDKNKITPHHLSMVEKALNDSSQYEKKVDRNTTKSDALFFLAEYYSKSNKSQSEQYYIEANNLIADMQRESLFLRQKYTKSIYDFFKASDITKIKNDIDPKKGEGLIFILGMPRSGTSLVESIFSTSKNLKAGGEKAFFSIQLYETITSLMESQFDLDSSFFKDLGDRYIEHIKLQRDKNYFFVDKLPENYLFLMFIKLCLPAAKFIHCYRDPWDNAISLYKQNYSINIFYASSFFGIATEYANYEFLMNFWKNFENESIFNVSYEDLIQNEAKIVKNLWQFCGFEGEYAPDKRKDHFTYTASMQQISKEIYDSSIKKNDFNDFRENFYQDLEKQRDYWKKRLQ